VLCVEHHKSLMYLESVEANGKVENFRCPQQGCHRALQMRSGEPPAYWLGEGFSEGFRSDYRGFVHPVHTKNLRGV
jgi:hypothetical protein